LLYSPWGKKQRERLKSLDDSLVNDACGLCRLARLLVSANEGNFDSTEIFIETWSPRFNDNYLVEKAELEIKLKNVSKHYTLFLDTGIVPAFTLVYTIPLTIARVGDQ
jgi:hypothetical protein